jgi:chemotaxis protein MotB
MASDRPIIIKKVKKGGGHGHHGGAWKVAYADFVTAMMAFFLLMWLINTTTPEQRQGIADYFAPASVSPTNSGGGGILAGTALGEGGSGRGASSTIERLSPDAVDDPETPEESSEQSSQSASAEAMAAARERREQQSQFASAEMSLRQSLQEMPELAELTRQLIIEETPEGLRIQLVDEEGRPMFNPGSVQPNERAVVPPPRRGRDCATIAEPDRHFRPYRLWPRSGRYLYQLGFVGGSGQCGACHPARRRRHR